MATDIMDKDLKQLRNAQWDKAFSEGANDDPHRKFNCKATIVIAHLIQAVASIASLSVRILILLC